MPDEVLEALKQDGWEVVDTPEEGETPEASGESAAPEGGNDAGSEGDANHSTEGEQNTSGGSNQEQKPEVKPQDAEAEKPEAKPDAPAATRTIFEMSGGKYNTLEEVMADAEEQRKFAEKYKPANARVEALNNFLHSGGTEADFNKIFSIDLDNNPDKLEVLKAGYRLENPDSTASDEDIEALLREEYRLDPEMEYTANATKAAAVKLDRDFTKTVKALRDRQKEISVAPTRTNYNPEEHIKQFVPVIENAVKAVSSVRFDINENGEPLEFVVPEKAKLAAKAYIEKEIKESGIPNDENAAKLIKATLENYYKLQLMPEIVKAAAKKGADKSNEEWIKKANNPSGLNSKSETDPRGTKSVDRQEQMAELIAKAEGIPYTPKL